MKIEGHEGGLGGKPIRASSSSFFMCSLVLIVGSATGMGITPSPQTQNTLTPAERTAGWRLLFDGKTTAGWHPFGMDASVTPSTANGWDVSDGTLVALGRGTETTTDIVTNEDYASFELLVDWKLAPQANSGIFFHVVEQGQKQIYATGPEYQLIDDDGWKGPLEKWQQTGANYAMHAPLAKAARPVGEWNQTRIVVNGDHVEHWLNGVKTSDYRLWTPEWRALKTNGKWKDYPAYGEAKQGKLGLQNHGNMSWFRNIKIRTGGFAPRTPDTLTRGGPIAPLRSRGSLALLAR